MDLNDKWTLYDHAKSIKDSYEQSIRKVGTLITSDDFCEIFRKYPGIENIFSRRLDKELIKPFIIHNNTKREISAISLFKDNIQPKWEDPLNTKGGEIQYKFTIHNAIPLEELDALWFKLVLYAVSGKFSLNHKITGVRIVDHTNTDTEALAFRIEIWFTEMNKNDIITLQEELGVYLGSSSKIVKMHR